MFERKQTFEKLFMKLSLMNIPWSSVTGRLKAELHGGGGWKREGDTRSDGRGPQESHARNTSALFIAV